MLALKCGCCGTTNNYTMANVSSCQEDIDAIFLETYDVVTCKTCEHRIILKTTGRELFEIAELKEKLERFYDIVENYKGGV